MKPIKTTTTAALMALAPIAAQAAVPMTAPMALPAPTFTGDAGQVQPVFLDLQQLERDMLVLLQGKGGNGGDSRDQSRDGNSDDGDSDDRNGGDSDGGNGGNS